MLWSKDEALFDYYGVYETPSTLLIDGNFRHAGDWSGRTPLNQVRKTLNKDRAAPQTGIARSSLVERHLQWSRHISSGTDMLR